MTEKQKQFFKKLSYIQQYCVQVTLSKEGNYDSIEHMLKEITAEAIYRVMELLDGYGDAIEKCKITETTSGEVINKDIELHDKCMEYLE